MVMFKNTKEIFSVEGKFDPIFKQKWHSPLRFIVPDLAPPPYPQTLPSMEN